MQMGKNHCYNDFLFCGVKLNFQPVFHFEETLMDFSVLEGFYKKWNEILVIGKTIEHDNMKYHIIGMTLSDEACLYIIEPYSEPMDFSKRKGIRNQRRILKEHAQYDANQENTLSYLHCSEISIGGQKLSVESGSGGSLKYSEEDYGTIRLFFDMIDAGWEIPEWLKATDWDHLQLVTLKISDLHKLPDYAPGTPITLKHSAGCIRRLLEKNITLNAGRSRSFSFIDNYGDEVKCYINNVTLMDVWKDTEEQFNRLNTPEMAEKFKFTREQLEENKKHMYAALSQSCPKGMFYIGIEYECSKDISLVFYSRQYLKSIPEVSTGSASFLLVNLKPDSETGAHNLPLKGAVIHTPVTADTVKIPAELFCYLEKTAEWEETLT